MLKEALEYAEKGFFVFPLIKGQKIPVTKNGFYSATTDVEQIKRWWFKDPKYNIGIRSGLKYKVLCLDVDNKKKDENGFLWLNIQEDLPPTPTQITASKGMQYLFQMPEEPFSCTAGKIAKGIDIRASGGYFVAPPSHVVKNPNYKFEGTYEWVSDQSLIEMELAPAPEWLLTAMRETDEPVILPDMREDSLFKEPLTIKEVLDKYKLNLIPRGSSFIFQGVHPIHGSTSGHNFLLNYLLNVWHCYRDSSGGGAVNLVAMLEGIIDCKQCKKGGLTGDTFKKTQKIIEEKFNISPDKFSELTLDGIIEKITTYKEIKDKWELLTKLQSLAKQAASLKQAELSSVYSFIKENLKINTDGIKAFRLKVSEYCKKRTEKENSFDLDIDKNGVIKTSDKNLNLIFDNDEELCDRFKHNIFSANIDVLKSGKWNTSQTVFPRTLQNDDAFRIKRFIIDKYDLEYRLLSIFEGIENNSIKNEYDPLIDYLDNLEWDGNQRLFMWLSYFCGVEENPYTSYVAQMILVAAVKRAYIPGCQYDHVVVLVGDQGIKKSSVINVLGGEWFLSLGEVGRDRDFIQKMQGKWFIELAEGIILGKKSADELKSFVTVREDKERFAYARVAEIYKRRSVFIMTINPRNVGYLTDPTGNRRFVPIKISKDINIEGIKKQRDQLFAEAVYQFKKGFKIYLEDQNKEVKKGWKDAISDAEISDEWAEAIYVWLLQNYKNFDGARVNFRKLTCLHIWEYCIKGKVSDFCPQREGVRIGKNMKDLGLKPKDIKINGNTQRVYDVVDFLEKEKKREREEVVKEGQSVVNF